MSRLALAVAVVALAGALAGDADAGRYAVGAVPGTSVHALERTLESLPGTSVLQVDARLRALTVSAPAAAPLRVVDGVAWLDRLAPRRIAFAPTDPLATRQWYLGQTRAFDHWSVPPPLPPVRVAVIDSGVDLSHPDLEERIIAARSFVGGRPADEHGHGTFIAGVIAAGLNNGVGIAGMAFNAELLVAKVVRPDGTVPVDAEARAIRWAADAGAQVINLSLGGIRDPRRRDRDTYSHLEAEAVRYAQAHGALVVAAVGNSTDAPSQPWPYANYPAALPHVLGVSAVTREGEVPLFSTRDRIYNDIAAPGQDIFSTFPRHLTAERRACASQGYSECGPEEYRHVRGTSFAAPQVSAAAALLLGSYPFLDASQVAAALTRSADDASAVTGCDACGEGRDRASGWGRLDVADALTAVRGGRTGVADAYEPNDDAGAFAWTLWGARGRRVTATVDYWDDQSDVYRVHLRPGRRLTARVVGGPPGAALVLWRPGTSRVDALTFVGQRFRAAQSAGRGSRARLAYRATRRRGGWYFLQVKLTEPGAGRYTLAFTKR